MEIIVATEQIKSYNIHSIVRKLYVAISNFWNGVSIFLGVVSNILLIVWQFREFDLNEKWREKKLWRKYLNEEHIKMWRTKWPCNRRIHTCMMHMHMHTHGQIDLIPVMCLQLDKLNKPLVLQIYRAET